MVESENGAVKPKMYSMFRKRFHVPSAWNAVPAFVELVEHRYQTDAHAETFKFIEERLRKLGYGEDNQRMTHDYLHYLLVDLLTSENIPYVTETDISNMPEVRALLNNKTPDLILKSNGSTRPKPLIVDVFVGKSEKEMSEKKSKYSSMGVAFDFAGLTLGNYNAELNKILPKPKIDYFHKQVIIFTAEYAYWMACLKLKKILFNERDNVPILPLQEPCASFIEAVEAFKVGLESKAAALADNHSV